MIDTRKVQPIPEVGMGCTEIMFSDRHAYTILEVAENGRTIVVQQDIATRTDKRGCSDWQDYDYKPDPKGDIKIVTLRKNGRWITKGEAMKNGTSWRIGERDEHYDFSF